MDEKNILIVHNYYQIPGGEDIVVINEKRMLEKHGHKVFLYCRKNSELKEMGIIQKIIFPFDTIFNFKTYKDIQKIIKENNIDIVHVHNTLCLISASVYYAAKSKGIPIVQTVHNFRFLCPEGSFYRDGHICEDCIKKGLQCAIKHKCYRESKVLTAACVLSTKLHRLTHIYKYINYICLTDFNKEKLLQFNQIKKNRVFVKPNFVVSSSNKILTVERKNRFIFAGRIDRLKGVDILLKAWKEMGNSAPELVVCGTGPMENWCRLFIDRNNLEKIKLKGFISNIEIRKMIADSKALILPTQWYEGFPISIIEAFSVGTPVICSDLGNAGDIVAEGITGSKFKHDSIKSLINAIKRLDNYYNINKSVYDEYKSKYTEDINYKKIMDIYSSVQ